MKESDISASHRFSEAVAIMARLRGPGGCPWDREQTFDSIKRHTLEETYEVFDAIERRAWPDLKDELGDLLLQVLFYAQMASEEGHFTISDVIENLNDKLIRRHPHIFGEVEATDASAVLRNWEQIKREEKSAKQKLDKEASTGFLDDIPRNMPATLEAAKLTSRAAKIGFDWPEIEGVFDKMGEEIAEVRAELDRPVRNQQAIADEIGDVLFAAVNLARHAGVDAEQALRSSNTKFRTRFASMEDAAGGIEQIEGMELDQMEQLWQQAKQIEREAK